MTISKNLVLKVILSIILSTQILSATHKRFLIGVETGYAISSYHFKVQNSDDDYSKTISKERLKGIKLGWSLSSHDRIYFIYDYSDFKTKLLNEIERIFLFSYDYLFDLDYARLKPFLGFSIGKYTSTSASFIGQFKNLYGLNMGFVFRVNRFIDFDIGYRYITDLKLNDTRLESTIQKDNIYYTRRFDAIQNYYMGMVFRF